MNKTDSVRVRFAPSPTGYLHIGGLRTALFNYLFARHNGGKFILRIEDTDRARQIPGAVDNLIDTLKQMGLDYDEGPYFQSKRLDIYSKHAGELVEKGNAYYCFCTTERLEEVRREQRIKGLQTQYDRFCRNLSDNEINEKLARNVPHVVRLKVPLDAEIKFNDLIRGVIKIETNQIDDQVLLKSDGFPTYHLANVIDDHLMDITHIIRGEEWLTSVPKHILLYQALSWNIPQLAHVPLILNPDKTKLSKRQGDVATEDFLSKGYLPEALINFIALLGWNPGEGDNREIFSKTELIKLFTLEKVHPSGAVFNIEKLDWMNSQYIKNYDINKLTELALPYLNKSGCNTGDKEKNKRIISALRTYIHKLEEIPEQAKIYCKKIDLTSAQLEIIRSDSSRKVLSLLLKKLDGINELIPENVKESLTTLQTETGIKGESTFSTCPPCANRRGTWSGTWTDSVRPGKN